MPKREPTPPLEDESKYLIINYPFPLHANMQIVSERYDLAHWVASCIGQEYLSAIYHKPTAPNMVIIEVMKSCPQINALLGLHKWCEFLRRLDPDQADKESRIYYCRHSTGREVQKHGWRRLDVWDSWFENYDPVNGPFVTNPYPKTNFCEVPPETQTDYGLCRPLPMDVFPRHKRTIKQPIVPGSDKYMTIKKDGGQPQSIAAPIPSKQPTKSWASITSSNTSRKTGVDWPGTTSRTSSTGCSSNASLVTTSNGNTTSLPSGLAPAAPPPGFSTNSGSSSSEWEFNPSSNLLTPSDASEWPSVGTKVEIITAGLAAAAIEDQEYQYQRNSNSSSTWTSDSYDQPSLVQNGNKDSGKGEQEEEEEVDLWAKQPERPADWDKPICPEHKVSCRAAICKVMDGIERKRKKEAEAAMRRQNGSDGDWRSRNGNAGVAGVDDGWETAKTKGRERGRGRGHGQSRGRARGRGGWC